MTKRKVLLFVVSVATALSLYVGYDVATNAYGVGNVALATELGFVQNYSID